MKGSAAPAGVLKKRAIIYNPEYSTMTLQKNLTKTNRKVTRNLKYAANHARVQLPSAGTLPERDSAEKVAHGLVHYKGILALGGVFGTGLKLHSRERLVLAPGIKNRRVVAVRQRAWFMPRRSQVQILPLQSPRVETTPGGERYQFIGEMLTSQTGAEKKSALRHKQRQINNAARIAAAG